MFIILFAAIIVVPFIIGIILLISSLINKNKKSLKLGLALSLISLIIFIVCAVILMNGLENFAQGMKH
jgi:hypothetical protein